MAQKPVPELKEAFKNNKTPDEKDFGDVLDSYLHKSTKINPSQVLGLNENFATKNDLANVTTNDKGIFGTLAQLQASYPDVNNKKGFYAFVGTQNPFRKYEVQASGGAWIDTGEDISIADVDLAEYAKTTTAEGKVLRNTTGKMPNIPFPTYPILFNYNNIEVPQFFVGSLEEKGTLLPDDNYLTTDFIEIEPNTIHSVSCVRISAQFDENKKMLDGTYSMFNHTGIQLTARKEARFFRFTVHKDNEKNFAIVKGLFLHSNTLNNGLPAQIEPILESVLKAIKSRINLPSTPQNILTGYSKVTRQRVLDIYGASVYTKQDCLTTELIELKPDTLYSINFFNRESANSLYMFYDENKEAIPGTRVSVIENNRGNSFVVFRTTAKTFYIRISSDYSTWQYVYLCEGISAKMESNDSLDLQYTPDYKAVNKIIGQTYITDKENILKRDLFTFSGSVVGQQVTRSDSDWLSTDYIELDKTKSNLSFENCRYIAFFDENKKFISFIDNKTKGFYSLCFYSGSSSYEGVTPFRIRPRYVRATANIKDLDFARLWYGSQSTTLSTDTAYKPIYVTPNPNTPHFKDSIVNLLNTLEVSYSGGTFDNKGDTVANTDWVSTNMIDITSLTSRHLYFKNIRFIAQYDENLKFLSLGYYSVGDGTGTGEKDIELLAETRYIRVCIKKEFLYNAFVSTEPLINKVSALRQGGVETVFNPDPDKVRAIMAEYGVNPVDIREPKTGYSLFADTINYRIWKSTGIPIRSLKGNFAVKYNTYSTVFYYSITGINGTYLTFNLNAATFPNLITGSVIWSVNLLGFDSTSDDPEGSSLNLEKGVRVCVITDKGQIYHNNPKGATSPAWQKFDESVVWDIEGRRLPSKTEDNEIYQLNPCLPDEAYMLTPGINVDNGYGNGGFPLQKTMGGKKYNRFYFHSRHSSCIPFWYMGGIAQNHKLQVIGTYRANKDGEPASRICLFASCDGGRQWHNIQEYANDDSTNYGMKFNARGNKLIPNGIVNNYAANSLDIQRITLNLPTATNKEPSTKFIIGSSMSVTSVTTPSNNIVLTTSIPHGLETGNRIVIRKSSTWSTSSFNFLINETMNEVSGGNFKTWRVQVLNSTQLELYEYIHGADSNIPCRHIHAINCSKNNFVVSCGEIYPQGWISMLMIEGSDSWYPIGSLYDLPYVRLTSAQDAIQRALGTLVMDDVDQTVIYASDDAMIDRNSLQLPDGRTTDQSYNSTGIYRGKLSDVDDINKFEVIYPAKQVAYLFQEYAGMWLFCGQQGEFAISIDKGVTWDTYSVGALPIEHPGGVLADGTVCIHGWIFYKK